MFLSRIVIRNYRNFAHLDVSLNNGVTCIVGENNTGKTNLLHAIRLAIDTKLSSRYRVLSEQDIHSGADFSHANQVLISIEFSDFNKSVNETALVGGFECADNIARINYRFRPIRDLINDIKDKKHNGKNLSLEDDYHFELTGGGDKDPASVLWSEELGSSIRFGDLQSFHLEYLKALRDVERSLNNSNDSPLSRIFSTDEFSDEEKQNLVTILSDANDKIESQPTIKKTGVSIQNSFENTSGDAFKMGVKLGMSDPSFPNISRAIKILLSNDSLKHFEPFRNGLGLNNILYIGILLDYFDRRISNSKTAGQLLLIEEPEAHLHPQLQHTLYTSLANKHFQTIITSHSTHITSQSPINSIIVLTNNGTAATATCSPSSGANLSLNETEDLNRFLDATKSTLLYARKLVLVEGPAELFLIPALVKSVMGIDLESHGISLIPIYGKHFTVYAKLFKKGVIEKKCAIITDNDMKPEDLGDDIAEENCISDHGLEKLESRFLKVFSCATTFERALTNSNTLQMIAETTKECGYTRTTAKIEEFIDNGIDLDAEALNTLRTIVLSSAKRCGKARFSQIASKHVSKATHVPTYISQAINWILE